MKKTPKITVEATAQYIESRSDPGQERYFFVYHIMLHNRGMVAARLMERHWIILDASGQTQEVRGEGVVGQTPRLAPGESFRYNSSAMIGTPVGTMQGEYLMVTDEGERFEAPIPRFVLSIPRVLH